MKKTLAISLLFVGLVTIAHAADVNVKVGGPAGENVFIPQIVMAAPGDNIVFTWQSGKHSVIESDAKAACIKSIKPDAFTSDGAFVAPNIFTIPAKTVGKTWFYCGVPGHCASGMYGTLIITGAGGPAGAPPVPEGDAPVGKGKGITPSTTSPTDTSSSVTTTSSSSASNNTSMLIGAIIGAMAGGSILTIGGYFIYKRIKNKNKNKKIIQIPDENRNNDNPRKIPENPIHNDTRVYSHGQEAIPIIENNDLRIILFKL
ncbi:hypothetical protein C1645_866233 [Glomus cerebriforme]|uniref:Phytocyanin domain-containing protein n=1 Tax=Glomus cerebriforme TaxID=658196 RepID=A0A397S7J2_9GLOM|nr:hypothetical protein C1645_866233 [Glomus cerebriforme]